jgi:flagellar biosynthetic protein FlhB
VADKGAADRTEKPTPKKLKEGLKQGQVARSPDLAAWTTVLIVTYLLPATVSSLHDQLAGWLRSMPDLASDPDMGSVLTATAAAWTAAGLTLLPLMGVVVLGALLAGIAQGGARPFMSRAKPKGSRISPAQGFKRLFSPHSLWELVKNLVKLTLVGVIAWQLFSGMLPSIMGAGAIPIATIASTIAADSLTLLRTMAVAGLAIGVGDYLVSKRRVTKQLMMSRKEIKDEYKQSEGDPHVKAQIRQRAIAIVRNRMMIDLPDADVVLVNPTHVAVALKYTPGRGAPRVLAKGSGHVAARIRAVAAEARIPMVEDVPLARALYASCEVGEEIPSEMFTAVARVLAFVMALRARGTHAGLHSAGQLALARA